MYIGSLTPLSNAYARYQTLLKMGYTVEGVDIDPFLFKTNRIFRYLHHHYNWGIGVCRLNHRVLLEAKSFNPDLIWVDNKPFLWSSTIQKIKKTTNTLLINVVTDDAFGFTHDGWQLLKKTMSYYDVHFVQRKVNVGEYLSYHANLVLECDRSFNPETHRPLKLTTEENKIYGCSVGFIGTYAPHREKIIAHLIQDGIEVAVWGTNWENKPFWQVIKPFHRGKEIYGDEYAKVICGMDIALHFLRKENRDDQDSRTFEIPACGTFMLAERTEKHLKYFDEGKEAEFFDSYEELKEKIKYYTEHTAQRKKIAEAGQKRSITDDYSHQARLIKVLKEIEKLRT